MTGQPGGSPDDRLEDRLDDGDDRAEPDRTAGLVRPFVVTRGRTVPKGVSVPIEALVTQQHRQQAGPPDVRPIELAVWRAASQPRSSVEISAAVDLPLGVVRVLIGDLVLAGHLQIGQVGEADDVQLLERLLDGVRRL